MPELRKDPITERFVIISTERSVRPSDCVLEEKPIPSFDCPFCQGREEETPPPIREYTGEDGLWDVRVIPNKYPVLVEDGAPAPRNEGMYEVMNGTGRHDVFIESRRHDFHFYDARVEEVALSFRAVRDRMQVLADERDIHYSLYFKNYKNIAGATLSHPHSQMISTPIVPKLVQEELNGAERYQQEHDRCVYCDIIKEDTAANRRICLANVSFVALAPYASTSPFEIWVLPKKHTQHFHELTDEEVYEFSEIVQGIFLRLDLNLGNLPFNYFLHTAPYHRWEGSFHTSYHWHLEIVPKLSQRAGFEMGSGFYINSFAPEICAKMFRDTKV